MKCIAFYIILNFIKMAELCKFLFQYSICKINPCWNIYSVSLAEYYTLLQIYHHWFTCSYAQAMLWMLCVCPVCVEVGRGRVSSGYVIRNGLTGSSGCTCLSRSCPAISVAYGGSQAREWIGAIAASLHHSQSCTCLHSYQLGVQIPRSSLVA